MALLSRLSLRTILTTSLLVFSLVPLALLGIAAWNGNNESVEKHAVGFAGIATNLADKIDRNLFERYGDVQAFGLNHVVRNRDAWYAQQQDNPIVDAMNSYVDTYDIYYLTLLVDTKGKLIAVNTQDHDGNPVDTSFLYDISFANTRWFANCKNGNFYENEDRSFTGTVVEHLYIDDNVRQAYGDEGLALGFSAPVYGDDGEVIAYWKNVAKFSLVEDMVLTTYLEMKEQGTPSAEITLLDSEGNIIIDCDPSKIGNVEIKRDLEIIGKFNLAEKNVEAAVNVVSGQTGSIVKSWHARKKINQVAGYAPLQGALGFPGMKWNVLVRAPHQEAFAALNRTRSLSLATIGVSACILTLLAFWLSRAISRVLQQAIESMEAAAKGDYSHNVEGRLSLDLVRLTSALNEMLSALTKAEERDANFREQIDSTREQEQRAAEVQQQKVTELVSVVQQVADGDLSVSVPELGDDAIGQIAQGVDKAVEAIRNALLQVRGVATTVASSANEMASTSEQISSGAQTQASSLEETAASLEQITSAVKQNTDNSQLAQQLSINSREVAESGGAVVSNAVDAMTAINHASKKIAEIITTIDEIAFQTNLLALNAAVEAARAGEQGRGFAVVASEVRNLAQRSAGAAKEIKNLIQDSVAKVENGTDLVNESGNTLQEIVTSVKKVADIVTEISAASTEQLTGIEQVNVAVSQMDRVTQANAAQTEEMYGSSESLLSHADNLRRLVSSFRLGNDESTGTSTFSATKTSQQGTADPEGKPTTPSKENNGVHELDLISVGADGDFEEF